MIFVDELRVYPLENIQPAARKFGKRWCHLITDGSKEDLHAFAIKIGLSRSWLQEHATLYHYDLVPSKRRLAVTCGAKEVTSREWAQSLQIHRATMPSTEAASAIIQHILTFEGGI